MDNLKENGAPETVLGYRHNVVLGKGSERIPRRGEHGSVTLVPSDGSHNYTTIDSMTVNNPVSNFSIYSFEGWRSNKEARALPVFDVYINDLLIKPGNSLIFNVPNYGHAVNLSEANWNEYNSKIGFMFDGKFVKPNLEKLSNGWVRLWASNTPWTPPPAPEPTTYGAIFGTVALGLVTFRRRVWAYSCSLASHRSA